MRSGAALDAEIRAAEKRVLVARKPAEAKEALASIIEGASS